MILLILTDIRKCFSYFLLNCKARESLTITIKLEHPKTKLNNYTTKLIPNIHLSSVHGTKKLQCFKMIIAKNLKIITYNQHQNCIFCLLYWQ